MGWYCIIPNVTFEKYIGVADVEPIVPDVSDACAHNFVFHVEAVAPTTTESGNKEYWHCPNCGAHWLDAGRTIPTTASDVILPATGEPVCDHEYDNACDAVCNKCGAIREVSGHVYDNEYDTTCNICGAVREVVIPDTYPPTDTLKGLYYLGGTQDESLADQSGNGNNATVKGTITYADGYATFADNGVLNRMDTPVLTSPENKTTIVALFRVPTGGRSIASTFKSNEGGFVFTNDRAYLRAVEGTSGVNKTFNAVGAENFALCAMSIDNNSCRVVKDANGQLVELLNTTENPCNWVNTISIGGYRSGMSFDDEVHIALVSIHEGDVSDEQLQQIFAHVRWYGASKGLTIE